MCTVLCSIVYIRDFISDFPFRRCRVSGTSQTPGRKRGDIFNIFFSHVFKIRKSIGDATCRCSIPNEDFAIIRLNSFLSINKMNLLKFKKTRQKS